MAENDFVRKSTVKDATDMNVGSDVYEALNDEIEFLLEEAEVRAKENGRKTIQAHDV
jgi:histone H3/H4